MPADIEFMDWWSSLNHGGLLIAPPRLPEFFSGALDRMPGYRVDRLRRDVMRVQADVDKAMGPFLDTVFEDLLALPASQWQKASAVDRRFSHASVTGEMVKPQRVWLGNRDEVLPLFVDKDVERLGIGKGRRQVSRVLEWLRALNLKLAVLTNGRQIRLVHAGADYDAFCEWDVELWFEEGAPGPQVEALRRLLSIDAIASPKPGQESPLLRAILASRRGQGELSAVLGERVRQAVEVLIQASGPSIEETLSTGITKVQPADVYIAATRTVMRLVVVLFAEARGLLPRENPAYHHSYGLQGLREELERSAGGRHERLRQRYAAWPRMLSLFRLIYEGSPHPDLPIQQYGGGLFVPGHDDSQDPVLRALAALESSNNHITDDVVYRLIDLLTRSRMKVRQGKKSIWVESPVDFSDLSSEYIGILYEGLLDFELRKASEPIVFVGIGDEPALPLQRLEDMDDKALKALFDKLKVKNKSGDEEAAEEEDADEEDEAAEDEDIEAEVETDTSAVLGGDDGRETRARVLAWARRAAGSIGTKKPDPKLLDAAAQKLIRRIVFPGEWFLVRWGGTRKGAGTFYTRPQLAGPTTRRTLQPLAYKPVRERTDEKTGLVDVEEWAPREPEAILALKVCDPAMGSGSFLVSALRYLTDALFESLHAHGRIQPRGDGAVARLADGTSSTETTDELLPVRPDHPDFDARLKARLKRHVVERCLYGVDIDAVAVELARMALWVETMDPALPFEFLDHKLKVGNSLVGCWFDRFQDYPLAAWEREAGDEPEANKKGPLGVSLSLFRDRVIKKQLEAQLRGRGLPELFSARTDSARALHDVARKVLDDMHAIPVHDAVKRAKVYTARVRDDASLKDLRTTFDAWCAIWFWPPEAVDDAPTPDTLHALPAATSAIVAEVAQREKFFHWELEYPDVFSARGAGFDAIVGNPPWNIQKPNSMEFFSNHDPLYRSYGKQEALRRQTEIFRSTPKVEQHWVAYRGSFKALSNWVAWSGNPCGDPTLESDGKGISVTKKRDSQELHSAWRKARASRTGYADAAHPFRHQGSADLNTYKMFLEQAHSLLRVDGQLGFIVPSGLYTDKGTTSLRELFLGKCRWQWLFGFENKEGIFEIHRSFKFAAVIVQKGRETGAVRAAFMQRRLDQWEQPHPSVLIYSRAQIEKLSPSSKSLLEVDDARDLTILEHLYSNAIVLGDKSDRGWRVKYSGEFHMTNDSKLFPPLTRWRELGFKTESFGLWRSEARAAVPIINAKLFDLSEFAAKGWVSGKGRSATWRAIDFPKSVEPEYLMDAETYRMERRTGYPKLCFKDITTAIHYRTMLPSLVPDWPAVNAAPSLTTGIPADVLALQTVLSSLALDYVARFRIGYLHLNLFAIEELPLVSRERAVKSERLLRELALRLSATHEAFAPLWRDYWPRDVRPWRMCWAATPHERARLTAMANASLFQLYGLTRDEVLWIIRECDHPVEALRSQNFATSLPPKGFWRVDDDRPPELRSTVLSLVAFVDLNRAGLSAFTDSDAWQLPDHLRLADYGLGHDLRAREPQPVASALGPRFLPWQEEQGVKESWEECEHHAALLQKLLPLPASDEDPSGGEADAGGARGLPRAVEVDRLAEPVERDLFGSPRSPTRKKTR